MAGLVKKEYQLAKGPKLIICKGSIPDWPKLQLERPDVPRPLAVVNAANQRLCGGGGVDGMIHARAGPELAAECLEKPEVRPGIRCPTGVAVETKGYNFKTDFIIHTCGPVYAKEREEECKRDLSNAYRNSMLKAQDLGVKCVAFAAISTGVYAYPFKDATKVSLEQLRDADRPLEELWIVLFTQGDFDIATSLADELELQPVAAAAEQDPPVVEQKRTLSVTAAKITRALAQQVAHSNQNQGQPQAQAQTSQVTSFSSNRQAAGPQQQQPLAAVPSMGSFSESIKHLAPQQSRAR